LPGPIPAKNFWSTIVYDTQTRSMLQTDQEYPAVSSQKKDLSVNADGSVDVYFGPKAPPGKENMFRQFLAGDGSCSCVSGPLEPWFKQTWRPDNIVLQQ
jgi:hypothetical protein